MKRYFFWVLFIPFFLTVSACSKGSELSQDQLSSPAKQAAKAPNPDSLQAEKEGVETNHYEAQFLDGSKFNSADYVGKKILFGFFSIAHKDAVPMLKALMQIKSYEPQYEFKIFAVSIDADNPEGVKKFLADNKIDLPVILDTKNLDLASQLKVENEVAFVALNNQHDIAFGIKKYVFTDMPDGERIFIDYLKENLSIKNFTTTQPHLGIYPQAPDFTFTTMDGKKMKLSDFRGKVVQLIFFSPKCPHCQHEMTFLRDKIYPDLHKKGYEVLAMSVLKLEGEVLDLYKTFHYTWPTADDSDRRVRRIYSTESGVPENFIIDKEGKIHFTSVGFADVKQDIYRMQIQHLLGIPQEPILSDKHFNGSDSCMICHEAQHADWSLTAHAHAFETLQIKGEEHNVECIGCHTLGLNDPRGYQAVTDPKTGKQVANVPPMFENVQCEHCHGIGGPHVSQPISREKLKETCLQCHTAKFSLNFDFDERIKKVDHSHAADILKMTEQQRLDLLKKVAKKPQDLFNTKIKYVGSNACMSCHADVYKNWEQSGHAQAFVHAKAQGKDTDASTLQRTTVGYGETGGYQEKLSKDFEGVGCESCHGPGEKHVASKKKEDIRGLGDDCPFCVVEQICLSCHDAIVDPSFNIHKGLDQVAKDHGLKK